MKIFFITLLLIDLINISYTIKCTEKQAQTPPRPISTVEPKPEPRRALEELEEDDCKDLETSDDSKFKCVLSEDHTKCVEIYKCIYKLNLIIIFISLILLLLLIYSIKKL